MNHQESAGRAEVVPSPEGTEGPERGGERPDAAEADIAWPRLRRCYHILMRLGREADLNGLPDPPSDIQAFRHLASPGQPADTTAETEHV
jgi:hypothetical protein